MNEYNTMLVKSMIEEIEYGYISYGNLHDNDDRGLKLIAETLQNAEKYRWHDLRKNPDDLPKDDGLVLVSLNGYRNKTTYDHAFDMAYWVCDGKFYDDMGMNVMVEAWREIEPFNEVDE